MSKRYMKRCSRLVLKSSMQILSTSYHLCPGLNAAAKFTIFHDHRPFFLGFIEPIETQNTCKSNFCSPFYLTSNSENCKLYVFDGGLFKENVWDAYLASPADFAGVDDIITNLAKEREPGDINRNP